MINTEIKIWICYANNSFCRTQSLSNLVNCPTRWSLLLIFGFLFWSSSWRWQPPIGVCRLLWPLLRAGMAFLTHFFLQNVFFICIPEPEKKLHKFFLQFYPLKELFFSWLPRFPELGFNRQLHTKASPELGFNRQSISDLQTHIGGSHPILYFKSQITKKYSIVLYYISTHYPKEILSKMKKRLKNIKTCSQLR